MKRRWRGIYSLHTKTNRYTQFTNLGETELRNSVGPILEYLVTVRIFGGTEMQRGRTDMVRVRA